MTPWIGIAASVAAVSAVSLIGAVTLAGDRKRLFQLTPILVSLSVGALAGGAFLHLIPAGLHAFGEDSDVPWLLVLAGFVASFSLERMMNRHHGHDVETTLREFEERRKNVRTSKQSVVTLLLAGDAVHNFVDGIVIAGAWLVSPAIGTVTTFVVLLHEMPQELADFGVLIGNGLTVKRALFWNFISALTAGVGALASLAIGQGMEGFADALVLLAAGNFIYVAAADLIPQLHERRGTVAATMQIATVCTGIALMIAVGHAERLLLGGH